MGKLGRARQDSNLRPSDSWSDGQQHVTKSGADYYVDSSSSARAVKRTEPSGSISSSKAKVGVWRNETSSPTPSQIKAPGIFSRKKAKSSPPIEGFESSRVFSCPKRSPMTPKARRAAPSSL